MHIANMLAPCQLDLEYAYCIPCGGIKPPHT